MILLLATALKTVVESFFLRCSKKSSDAVVGTSTHSKGVGVACCSHYHAKRSPSSASLHTSTPPTAWMQRMQWFLYNIPSASQSVNNSSCTINWLVFKTDTYRKHPDGTVPRRSSFSCSAMTRRAGPWGDGRMSDRP